MPFELRHFDFPIFTASTAACYVVIVLYLLRRGIRDRLLLWGAVLIALLLPLSWLTARDAERSAKERFKDSLKRFVPVLAEELRDKGHADFDGPFDASLAANATFISQYNEMLETEKRWVRVNESVMDVFTFVYDNIDKIYRVVVNSDTDYNLDGTIQPEEKGKAPGSVLQRDIGEGRHAFETQFVFDERVQTDFMLVKNQDGQDSEFALDRVTAYAPISNEVGKVKAVLAVDIKAADWKRQILGARLSALSRLFSFAVLGLAAIVFVSMLTADVRASKKKEEELREAHRIARAAAEEAQKATEAKGQFLANMSHEIRTPMNGVIGMSELMLQTELNNEQRQYQGFLLESARSLLDLINDILDFSKIEAGKVEVEKVPLELHDLVAQTLQALGRRANEKKLELILRIDPNLPYVVRSDPTRLRQIVTNLVSNAVKFTRSGEIKVALAVAEPSLPKNDVEAAQLELLISVKDTGIGIPKSQQTKIFEAFTQADTSTTRDYGGTGLGLAICSNLTKLLGGKIWLESEVGKGSTFFVQFPVDTLSDVEVSQSIDLSGRRILVVDDNETNRRFYSSMLERAGCETECAIDGHDAIDMLQNPAAKRYDLVLLDVLMPKLDGYDVVRKLALNSNYKTPIIMLSSMDCLSSELPKGDELIKRQLFKPAMRSELLAAIRDALAGISSTKTSNNSEKFERTNYPKHVLVADDSAINRSVAQSLLERRGHQVTVAVDGEQAVSLWKQHDIDIILMDAQMPKLDGVEATRSIRMAESKLDRRTPIVAMTAHAMRGDREKYLASGMDGYISKPFRPIEMFELVETLGLQRNRETVAAKPTHPNPDRSPTPTTTTTNAVAPKTLAKLLDTATLLSNTGGDSELAQQMIDLFLTESKAQLEQIQNAIASRDGIEISKAAHLLRGSVAIFGATRCVNLLRKMEALGQARESGDAKKLQPELVGVVHELCSELETAKLLQVADRG